MADDLEEFLKQAALRRQQRQQQRGNREPVAPPKPQASSPQTPRLVQQESIPAAQLVDEKKPYQPTVINLSSSLPSATLAGGVDQADERMQAHLKEAFQHELGSLRPSETKVTKKKAKKEQRLLETPATPPEVQPTAKVSSASLIAQLRDPQSLRMAIIAHEIMKRPWQ